MRAVGLLLLVSWFALTLPTCKDDEKLSTGDLVLYYFIYAANTFTYRSSCASVGTCANYYVSPINSPPVCSSPSTAQSTKCSAASIFGACTTAVSGIKTETVYYTTNTSCTSVSACQTLCSLLGGTFDAGYTGQ